MEISVPEASSPALCVLSNTRVRVVNSQNSSTDAFWLKVPSTFQDLKLAASALLKLNPARTTIYLNGAILTSVDVVRDGDLLELTENSHQSHSRSSRGAAVSHHDEWITLNVGGKIFVTTRLTLVSTEPTSILAKMFETSNLGRTSWSARKDPQGAILIDRSGELFEPLLNYLRSGRITLTEPDSANLLYAEAEFYCFDKLMHELRPFVNTYQRQSKVVEVGMSGSSTTLTRADVIRALMVTPCSQELRFQGMDFEGCDLSKLDLRCINFKMSNLRGTNLSYANLSYANFDRADLSDAILDHCVMFGIKMPCAAMERCSMQNVNADDPAGLRANFEGVNLRNAKIDNSQLNGSNFRVANLKYSSMKNCELKQASFPGANMEMCDLSGSNLFEANLRGANLVETNFGHLANALHMSQTI